MIHVKGIDWQPIDSVPPARKDGNDVLLHDGDQAEVGYWSDSGPSAGSWIDHYGDILKPKYWAEITPPE